MFIDNTLYTGRPSGARIPKEERCYDLLDSLGITYFRVDHDYADTIEVCHSVEEILGCSICKNLFLTNRQQTDFYLLLMPGDKPFKTKHLSQQIGSARLSFASAEDMERLMDITPGSVSILGLMNDKNKAIHFLMDRDLKNDKFLGCHPCINSSTLRLSMADVMSKLIPALGHALSWVELPWELEQG